MERSTLDGTIGKRISQTPKFPENPEIKVGPPGGGIWENEIPEMGKKRVFLETLGRGKKRPLWGTLQGGVFFSVLKEPGGKPPRKSFFGGELEF